MIWLVIRLVLELAWNCHCSTWTATPHGMRCTVVLERPRCEFVEGVHAAAFGVLVCTKGCEP